MTTKPTSNPTDALLDELNGALARTQEPKPVAGESQEQAPGLAAQLEVAPAASSASRPAPKAAQFDKTLSKAGGGHGYCVVVEGEYYAKSIETKGHVTKPYRLPFNLPALVNAKGESALGIIVGQSRPGGGMLKAALKKLDPLATTFRTHVIVSAEPLNGAPEPTSLQYMSFEALKKYVSDNVPDFPVPLDEYWDANHLREDVIDYRMNRVGIVHDPVNNVDVKGGFGVKKPVAERIIERHAGRKEEKELLDMNEGLAS
jgi:hypothetical protein